MPDNSMKEYFDHLYEKMPAQSLKDVSSAKCGGCELTGEDCQHTQMQQPLYMGSQCHRGASTDTVLYKGSLFVICTVCGKPVVRYDLIPHGVIQ